MENVLRTGPPTYDDNGRYTGPLDSTGGGQGLIGKEGRNFATKSAAAWPAKLCEELARLMLKICPAQETGKKNGGQKRTRETEAGTPPQERKEKRRRTETPTTRERISKGDLAKHREGLDIGPCKVYVGRAPAPGGLISKWSNPFKLGKDGSRQEVLEKLEAFLREEKRADGLEELRGKTLLCHCSKRVACHADILVKLLGETGKNNRKNTEETGAEETTKTDEDVTMTNLTTTAPYFLGTAKEEDPLTTYIDDGLPVKSGGFKGEDREEEQTSNPDVGWTGRGPPRRANYMGKDKPYSDGGGGSVHQGGGTRTNDVIQNGWSQV